MRTLAVAESYPGYRYHLRWIGPGDPPLKFRGHA
jgi:hypothetical protein